jgi:oxygen-independent coproporphyrinogen-3 oxidase
MLGLYIHIPFCEKKCGYCDFVSYSGKNDLCMESYVEALSREMEQYRGAVISTVYVGGGTPSLLSAANLEAIFSAVQSNFLCGGLSEISVEVNPDSATRQKLSMLRVLGVNRISIGIQSFDDSELKFLGRVHNASQAKECFKAAREEGFGNISVDLMYGFPDQTEAGWEGTLRKVTSMRPEHISLYPLTVEPETPFFKEKVYVDPDKQASMFEKAMDKLKEEGYSHYEISNWASPGYESRHNSNYWNCGEYIGLGVSASSHLGKRRWKNISSVEEYIAAVNEGANIVAEMEELTDQIRLSESVILPLRLKNGVQVSNDILRKYGKEIDQLVNNNLLYNRNSKISLTRKGILLANQVMKEFI